jgi:hypothetical protein
MQKLSDYIKKTNIDGFPAILNSDCLHQCEEFKHVKKINILDFPIFKGDEKTGEPLNKINDYLGSDGRIISTVTYVLKPDTEFNDEIDLYQILLSPKMYDPNKTQNLDYGVWLHPTFYDAKNFTPIKKIEIKYSIGNIAMEKGLTDTQAKEEAKRIILAKVAELIDLDVSNIPYEQEIMIRCSPRSVKNKQ